MSGLTVASTLICRLRLRGQVATLTCLLHITTSMIQPMDQGVIINLKVYYRKQLKALGSWFVTVRNRKKTVTSAMLLQKSKDFADFWHRFHHKPVLALSMEENGQISGEKTLLM